MAVSIRTHFGALLALARECAQAQQSADAQRIAQAQARHDAYKAQCLRADAMSLGVSRGALESRASARR